MKQQKNEFIKSWTGGINPAAGETGISSLFSERNCISPIPIAPSEDVVLLQPANNPVNQYFQSKAWYLIRITVAFLPQHRNACASVKQSQNVKEGRSKKIQKREGRKRELSLCWPVPKHSHLVHSTALPPSRALLKVIYSSKPNNFCETLPSNSAQRTSQQLLLPDTPVRNKFNPNVVLMTLI